jgi:hypothetical protein
MSIAAPSLNATPSFGPSELHAYWPSARPRPFGPIRMKVRELTGATDPGAPENGSG